ncbi:MAG: AraC family transcriptional regulator [Deltaproteobacteria bacterium]|nr:AraC family transcriptional regulator [Deltaproteobacteria bacterium]
MSWIRSAATRAVLAAARSRGHGPDQVLALAGVGTLPEDPWATIPLTVHFGVIGAALALVKDPGFPIDMAEHVAIDAYDVMGFATRSAPNLSAAVLVARRYQSLYTNSSVFEIDHDPRGLRVWMRPSGPLPLVARCATECVIAQITHMARTLAGAHLIPRAVAFRHPCPRSVERHLRFFGVEPQWDQPFAEVLFSPEDAVRPVVHADPSLHSFLLRAAEAALLEHRSPISIVEEARRIASELIPSGRLDIEAMAARLGLTSRTLRRRLVESGTSYLQVRDQVRWDLAVQYLSERDLPIAEIAFLLGFADERAFRRSFQRWTGRSPAQFRAGRAPAAEAPLPASLAPHRGRSPNPS